MAAVLRTQGKPELLIASFRTPRIPAAHSFTYRALLAIGYEAWVKSNIVSIGCNTVNLQPNFLSATA
jgi:hypothetical protein